MFIKKTLCLQKYPTHKHERS